MKLFLNISKITSHFRKYIFEIFWQFQNGNMEVPQVLVPSQVPSINYARNASSVPFLKLDGREWIFA